MNILHMKYAYEVAKAGSLGKAAETLVIAAPNLSRSIKELESELGITIFDRTPKGMFLTSEGEVFMNYAHSILEQIDYLENAYKDARNAKQKFSISVPRACYISDAFAHFSKNMEDNVSDMFYQETNFQNTISNVLQHDYKLGVIRYSVDKDNFFKKMFLEKGLNYELVSEFNYSILTGKNNIFAHKENICEADLEQLIEICYADRVAPADSTGNSLKKDTQNKRRIFVLERASRFDLLRTNPHTFMWASPTSDEMLKEHKLVQKEYAGDAKAYKDVIIYKNNYKLTDMDNRFITELCNARRKHF